MNTSYRLFVSTLLSITVPVAAPASATDDFRALRRQAEEVADLIVEGQPAAEAQKALAEAAREACRTNWRGVYDLTEQLIEQADEAVRRVDFDLGMIRYQAALIIREAFPQSSKPDEQEIRNSLVAQCLQRIGDLYRRMGRFADSEGHLRRALNTHRWEDGLRCAILLSLAELHRSQQQLAEAEARYKELVAIVERLPGNDPGRPPLLAAARMNLGICYYDMALTGHRRPNGDSWKDSEQQYRLALQALAAPKWSDHPGRGMCFNNLGRLYHGRLRESTPGNTRNLAEEADQAYQTALKILNRNPQQNQWDLVDTYNKLARLYLDLDQLETANGHIEEAFRLLQNAPLVELELHYTSHYEGARIAWAGEEHTKALARLREAMRLALIQRSFASGTAYDTATYFTQLNHAFERMVGWQTELFTKKSPLASFEEAYQAVERSRALAMVDQMRLQGSNIWDMIPPDQVTPLRDKAKAARERIVDFEQRSAGQATDEEWSKQLAVAREALVEAERDFWLAIRRHMPWVSNPSEPVPLRDLQQWVDRERCLVLQYLLGVEGGYVLVIPPGNQRVTIERLSLTAEQARALGVAMAGPLTASRFEEAMQVVKPMFQYPHLPLVHERLHALWQVLVPEYAQNLLAQDQLVDHLLVIPDGPLAWLPFDALATSLQQPNAPSPTYLLDWNKPVFYAPSASVLMELAQPVPIADRAVPPILSVAKRYHREHPRWGNLNHAIVESNKLVSILRGAGQACQSLLEEEATEANVQNNLAGRQIVHFACHGYADFESQNLTGALVLSVGDRAAGARDDGNLMLAELAPAALRGCELTVLSACDTNLGPHQRGEGVWALSRAFLVAGSRRVIATNWKVDDEAAQHLVEFLAQEIAKAIPDGDFATLQYARHLHDAKLAMRRFPKDPQWNHPSFWAAFQVLGYK